MTAVRMKLFQQSTHLRNDEINLTRWLYNIMCMREQKGSAYKAYTKTQKDCDTQEIYLLKSILVQFH